MPDYNAASDINNIIWFKGVWESGNDNDKAYAEEQIQQFYQSLIDNGQTKMSNKLKECNKEDAIWYLESLTYLDDYIPVSNTKDVNNFQGTSESYNPYSTINEIAWLKGVYENGTDEEKRWASLEAKKYYTELEENGYYDIAETLRNLNYNQSIDYKKNFNSTIPVKQNIYNLVRNNDQFSPTSDDYDEAYEAAGFYNYYDLVVNKNTKFNRMSYYDLNNKILNTREYLFFTKPDLNILEPGTNYLNSQSNKYPTFVEINERTPFVLEQLQQDSNHKSPFINILSNTVRNTLDLPTITTKSIETSATTFGSTITYRKNSISSDEKHSFSLEFQDNATLEIYNLFDAWNYYGDLKHLGYIKPKKAHITNCELDDQITIYKIITEGDNQSIIYMAKVVGVFPEVVPRESLSEISNGLTYNIGFKGSFVPRDMATCAADFNLLTKDYYTAYSEDTSLYNFEKQTSGARWASIPYIAKVSSGVSYKYLLRWRG